MVVTLRVRLLQSPFFLLNFLILICLSLRAFSCPLGVFRCAFAHSVQLISLLNLVCVELNVEFDMIYDRTNRNVTPGKSNRYL